jgi:hypothetical protein
MLTNIALLGRRALLAISVSALCIASVECGVVSQTQKKGTMQASNTNISNPPKVTFAIAPHGWKRLLAEQAATFDLVLTNLEGHAIEIYSLSGNRSTPVLQVYDEHGALIAKADPATRQHRISGHKKIVPGSPETVNLNPGEVEDTWINLWKYIDPLAPGRYALDVTQELDASGKSVRSNRLAFEILRVSVKNPRLSYGSNLHDTSLLAWVAHTPTDEAGGELMLRLSTFGSHRVTQAGATPLGHVPAAALVDLSAPGIETGRDGWVSVISPGLELIRQRMTGIDWKSGPVALDLTDVHSVPGFPDRGYAVFLATGRDKGGKPVLAGFTMRPEAGAAAAWNIPLKENPVQSACVFPDQGLISVLLVHTKAYTTSVSRLDVSESGTVTLPQREAILTANEILAVAADSRFSQPKGFAVLEADRIRHDRLAVHRFPLEGSAHFGQLAAVPGWPAKPDPAKPDEPKLTPVRAAELAFEIAMDGTPWIAFVDDDGRFFGGPLDGSALFCFRSTGRCTAPHVAALNKGVTLGCFMEDGRLFLSGGGY